MDTEWTDLLNRLNGAIYHVEKLLESLQHIDVIESTPEVEVLEILKAELLDVKNGRG